MLHLPSYLGFLVAVCYLFKDSSFLFGHLDKCMGQRPDTCVGEFTARYHGSRETGHFWRRAGRSLPYLRIPTRSISAWGRRIKMDYVDESHGHWKLRREPYCRKKEPNRHSGSSNMRPRRGIMYPRRSLGYPTSLGITGRCDLLAGHAAAAWSHDPESTDPAAAQAGGMRNILNARPASLLEDANRTLTTCIDKYSPGRSHLF